MHRSSFSSAHHYRHPGADASSSEITGWVSGALPPELYRTVPSIDVDRDEILVVGDVGTPEVPEGLDAEGVSAAEEARIARFREETRDQRIAVARQAESRYARPISWGATSGSTSRRFTTVHAPVAARFDLEHRRLLDTLVKAGIARNRSHALAWCVDVVQQNEEAWLSRLDEALTNLRSTAAERAHDE